MLNMLPRIIHPNEMVIKKGSLIRLKFLLGKRAVVLCGGESIQKYGHLEKIESYLTASKIENSVVKGIVGDPSEKSVIEISDQLKEVNPDWVIGVGGGSVMDTAKLAWALYEHPKMSLSEFKNPFSIPKLRKKAKLCLIPTTAGTGSEVSNSAVVILEGNKIPILSSCFLPDIAILDPNLTISLPKKLTASTALDAFTHGVESYCSKLNNSLTSTYAISGAKLIFENLKEVIETPDNIHAREKLLYGSMLAGLAQGVTSVGGIHALSHSVASSIGLPHGHLNALFLVPMLKFNALESNRVLEFVKQLGLSDIDELEKWVSEIIDRCDLSNKWGDYSKPFNLDEIAQATLNDICARTNPRKLTVEGVKSILEATR